MTLGRMMDELESDIPSCEGHIERTLVFLAMRIGEAMLNGMGLEKDVFGGGWVV